MIVNWICVPDVCRDIASPAHLLIARLFPAFSFAHPARCAAAIFLRAAAESVRFPRIGTTFDCPLASSWNFAQRAVWAAAIRSRVFSCLHFDSLGLPVPVVTDVTSCVPFCARSVGIAT